MISDDEDHDRDRVGHRGLDLAAQADLGLEQIGQAQQHVVERRRPSRPDFTIAM